MFGGGNPNLEDEDDVDGGGRPSLDEIPVELSDETELEFEGGGRELNRLDLEVEVEVEGVEGLIV